MGVSWDYFPKEIFGGGTLTGRGWKPGDDLKIPSEIIIHHANWTYGLEDKINQLQFVRSKVLGDVQK